MTKYTYNFTKYTHNFTGLILLYEEIIREQHGMNWEE